MNIGKNKKSKNSNSLLSFSKMTSFMSLLDSVQVTHRETGEVMVLKEMLHYDEDASSGFLKEVN